MPKPATRTRLVTTRSIKRKKTVQEIHEHLAHPHILRHEQISRRAYELYLEEGRIEGRQLDHWFRAENEIDG